MDRGVFWHPTQRVFGKWRDSTDFKWNHWHVSRSLTGKRNNVWNIARFQCYDAANSVMRLLVSLMTVNLLRSWGVISFSRKSLLHTVTLIRLTMWHMSTLVSVLCVLQFFGTRLTGWKTRFRQACLSSCLGVVFVIMWCFPHLTNRVILLQVNILSDWGE